MKQFYQIKHSIVIDGEIQNSCKCISWILREIKPDDVYVRLNKSENRRCN